MAVKLNVLNVGQGGKDMYIENTTPEERDALAEEVLGLMKLCAFSHPGQRQPPNHRLR